MQYPIYAVYGTGGCGRGIMPLARAMLSKVDIPPDRLVFVDDSALVAATVNGHAVLNYEAFLNVPAINRYVAVGIASGRVRSKLVERCARDGVNPWSVTADNVVTMDEVEIGEGAILSPFVTFTSNIRVGRHFHANIYSHVEHDCQIGDFVTFAPAAKCNGNTVIEDFAYIGSNAVIRQGTVDQPLVIGKGAVVGMGAVVTKSVAPGVTVVGNPALPIRTEVL